MRDEKFNDEEVNDTTKLRQVRRMAARVPPLVAAKKTSIDDAKSNSKKRLFTENSEEKSKNPPMTRSMTVPGVKKIRKTTRQTQDFHKAKAFKRCTTWYAKEKRKPKGLSARKVVESVNDDLGTNISVRTVLRYVQIGMVGVSPKKNGPAPGLLPNESGRTATFGL